jgi:purine-binding chemotaxis protein CheW
MSDASATRAPVGGGKFLTFFLAGEEYGVQILKVHEIISMLPITRVPRTPQFVRGVINLRGKVVPVIDLRAKLAMPADAEGESCIVIVQVRALQIGIVVDRVSEVTTIGDADIEPTPAFGPDVATEYLLGLAKADGRVRLLLDIERVLTSQEIVALGAVRGAA